jgi:hypothetical protein
MVRIDNKMLSNYKRMYKKYKNIINFNVRSKDVGKDLIKK